MSSIMESIIESVTHLAIDTFCYSVADHCLKDENKVVRIIGNVGSFIIGEMVAEKAAKWTNDKIQEAIDEYVKAAESLESGDEEKDYEVR